MGVGNLGLGDKNLWNAERFFNEVLIMDVNHQGALIHKKMTKNFLRGKNKMQL